MKLEQTDSLGGDAERILEFRGETYDLTDAPLTWYTLQAVFFGLLISVLLAVVYVGAVVFEGLVFAVGTVPSAVWSTLAVMILAWIGLGIIKFVFTGSAKPFFRVEYSVTTDKVDEN